MQARVIIVKHTIDLLSKYCLLATNVRNLESTHSTLSLTPHHSMPDHPAKLVNRVIHLLLFPSTASGDRRVQKKNLLYSPTIQLKATASVTSTILNHQFPQQTR